MTGYVDEFEGLWAFSGNPESINQMEVCFSDQGAWHGYVMPAQGAGWKPGFVGPFTFPTQTWRTRQTGVLRVLDADGNQIADFSGADVTNRCFPHKLVVEMEQGGWRAVEELGFLDTRSSGIVIKLTNNIAANQAIRLEISSMMFPEAKLAWSERNGVVWGTEGIDFVGFRVLTDADISLRSDGFAFTTGAISLAVGESAKIEMVIAADFDEKSLFDHLMKWKVGDVAPVIEKENARRWNGIFDRILSKPGNWVDANDPVVRKVTAKSIAALIYNWFSPAGELEYNSVFPSIATFTKNWGWDTWKHSAALAFYEQFLAKEGIRTMFSRQRADGMVPDTVGFWKNEDNWADSKPPLAAWAAWMIFEQDEDIDFLREVYPKILAFHRWWFVARDIDHDGLCEYGAEEYDIHPAKWESGMDNSIRYDEMKLIPNGNSWSMDMASVDLSAYLYADKLYLAKIANVLGLGDADVLLAEAAELKEKVTLAMFDPNDGIYYDMRVGTSELINVKSPAAWIPLWAGMSDQAEANAVREHIVNPKEFWTYVPFPTASRDDAKFTNDGYWRGPVWLDQAYFGVKALVNYGFVEDAREGARRLFHNVDSAVGTNSIRELYDPDTGAGLNAKNFGWSSAAYIMMYLGR